MTALHEATKQGNLAKVQELLEAGVNVNARDRWGNTPLYLAVRNGHTETTKLLLDNGAEVNARQCPRCTMGYTPLHLAARDGHILIAELLLDSGANVNARHRWGGTPLYFAVERGHKEIAKLLLEKRGHDIPGSIPFCTAAWNGHIGLAALLWQHQLQNTVAGTIIGACAGIAAGCFLAGVSVPALPWILLGAVVGMAVGSEIEGYIKYSPTTWQERNTERDSQSR